MQKLLRCLMLISIVAMMFALPVMAAESVPNGYTAIRTEADLMNIKNNMAGNYILMNDIVLKKIWNSIGYHTSSTQVVPFTGVFDGNGHTISGYRSNVNKTGFIYHNKGKLLNLTLSGASNTMNVQGVFCYTNEGLIQNCHNKVTLTNMIQPGGDEISAGMIATINQKYGIIEQCSNQAKQELTVNAGGSLSVGGIVGTNNGTVRKCWNEGKIVVYGKGNTSGAVAGIVGEGGNGSIIENCYNTGAVHSQQNFNSDFSYNYLAGGIMAQLAYSNAKVNIKNCYNTGTCSAHASYSQEYVGSITAYAPNTKYTNCYFLTGTADYGSYKSTPKNVYSLSSYEMRQETSYSGFDFTNTWTMGSNSYRYPILKNICTHQVDMVSAVNATCTTSGNIKHWYCNLCNLYFSNSYKSKQLKVSEVIIPAGHDEISHDGKPASCMESGWKEYVTCSRCDYNTYEEIPALGHILGTHEYNAKEHKSVCSVCGVTLNQSQHMLDNNGHCECGFGTFVINVIDPLNRINYSVVDPTMIVSHTAACIVTYKTTDDQYTTLSAIGNSDGSYSYTIPTNVTTITIAIKGDYNADGDVTVDDAKSLQNAILGKEDHIGTPDPVCDINGDGRITAIDLALIAAAALNKFELSW